MFWQFLWMILIAWNSYNVAYSISHDQYGWAFFAAVAAGFSVFMYVREVRRS